MITRPLDEPSALLRANRMAQHRGKFQGDPRGGFPAAVALWCQADDGAPLARLGGWSKRRAYAQTVGAPKPPEPGTLPDRRRRANRNPVRAGPQRGAQRVGPAD